MTSRFIRKISVARICREKSEYMPFVVEAAINAIKECQEAFKDRRWNCSSILYAPKYLPDLRREIIQLFGNFQVEFHSYMKNNRVQKSEDAILLPADYSSDLEAFQKKLTIRVGVFGILSLALASLQRTIHPLVAQSPSFFMKYSPDNKSGPQVERLTDIKRLKCTQEQAYVHALAAASLIYSIARACSKNGLASCPCGRKPAESASNYKWDGCSDNVDHGYAFSVDWINAPSKGRHRKRQNDAIFSKNLHLPLKQRINSHNSEVGRKIIAQNLEQKCRCHGVSMSCSLKSCYKILKPIKNISLILQSKYSLAKEVKETHANSGVTNRKSPDHLNHHHFNNYRYNNRHQHNRITVEKFEHVAYSKITDDDLVYSKKSPDYCSPNLRLGSLGTVGRYCNASSSGSINCNSMCCGRGYRISEKTQKYQCHCQFVYCCSVECKICERSVEVCK